MNKHTDIEEHIDLLGKKAKDLVTGTEGIVTSVSFDLYGCIQATLNRGLNEKNEPYDQYWIDVCRLEVLEEVPVMPVPDFDRGYVAEGKKGSADKPVSSKV